MIYKVKIYNEDGFGTTDYFQMIFNVNEKMSDEDLLKKIHSYHKEMVKTKMTPNHDYECWEIEDLTDFEVISCMYDKIV